MSSFPQLLNVNVCSFSIHQVKTINLKSKKKKIAHPKQVRVITHVCSTNDVVKD